jgi:hypothetical protein
LLRNCSKTKKLLQVARTEKSCSKRKKLLKSCRAQSGHAYSKIKLLYLLAPSLFLLNRANCSACVDKFPTCWNRWEICCRWSIDCGRQRKFCFKLLKWAKTSFWVSRLGRKQWMCKNLSLFIQRLLKNVLDKRL